MIINFLEKGIEVISHPAHGLLAGKIADQLKNRPYQNHWMETLTAIIEHDDEQLSNEAKNNISDLGMAMDFVTHQVPLEKMLVHAKAVFKKVLKKSSWSAMLLTYHLEFLYSDKMEEVEDFKAFLKELKDFRSESIKFHGIDEAGAEELYKIMLFSDRLSLILCQEETPTLGRKLEINKSIKNHRYFIYKTKDTVFTVEPWPFRKNHFSLCVDARVLKELKFKDEKHFNQKLDEASIEIKTFQFSKFD
ncbi:DUF3891 family protein [Zobellia alginiliquefaciens]|uniref:DUF3891 family protein n=1 Tax=Zobellia alginiliquefaciens TaxID=3032586 RepID=UPI0023E43107|nr:DUF3891 family protein [Zobellia alginiliquefaciens]